MSQPLEVTTRFGGGYKAVGTDSAYLFFSADTESGFKCKDVNGNPVIVELYSHVFALKAELREKTPKVLHALKAVKYIKSDTRPPQKLDTVRFDREAFYAQNAVPMDDDKITRLYKRVENLRGA